MKKSELEATLAAYKQENQRLATDGISQAKEIIRLNDSLAWKCMEIDGLKEENRMLREKIVMYKRSFEVGDDR